MKSRHSVCTSIFGAAILFAQSSNADDWDCKVLLCLSDPRGPTTEAACLPPINKLWDHLRKGRAFPTCDMASNAKAGKLSYAQRVFDPYDPCPDGTKPAGGYIAAARSSDRADWQNLDYSVSSQGREFDNQASIAGVESANQRACVGTLLGSYSRHQSGTVNDTITVQVYDQVVWQKLQSPHAIDVYIDGIFQHRVRY